jgi:hypothetical protein
MTTPKRRSSGRWRSNRINQVRNIRTAGTMMQYARLLRVTRRKTEAEPMEARARAVETRNAQQCLVGYTVDAADLRK